jgi:hypothetical protein
MLDCEEFFAFRGAEESFQLRGEVCGEAPPSTEIQLILNRIRAKICRCRALVERENACRLFCLS